MLVGLLAGCDGSDDSGTNKVTVTLDAAGGTVTGPDGVQVVVPPGALSQATAISIARSSVGAPDVLEAYPLSGHVYELTPHDLIFNIPVTVRVPVPSGTASPSVFMASPGNDWNLKDAIVTNGMAEWSRNSFSYLYMGVLCSIPTSMINDPYWCQFSQSTLGISATPTKALSNLLVPVDPVNGVWGAYSVNEVAGLELRSAFSVAGNCRAISSRLVRGRMNTSTLAWGDWQLVATQTPVTTSTTHRLQGIAIFNVSYTHLDNGKSQFQVFHSYECPTTTRSNDGSGHSSYAWNTNVYASHGLVDTVIINGNMAVPTTFYKVGGTVSGYTNPGLVLQNNGGNDLTIDNNGTFGFVSTVGAGASYNVTALTQPANQTCTVQNGSGTANADVTNVAVSCSAAGLAVSPSSPTANGCSRDTITFTASGGTAPYTWSTSEDRFTTWTYPPVNLFHPTNLRNLTATTVDWLDSSDNFCGVGNSGTVTITVKDALGATMSTTMAVSGI
jgi:hypothetical protein